MRLVDLRQAAVDDFFVQLFLLLEAEHLAGFLVEDAGDAVKGGIVEIGIEGRDGFDRHVEGLAERQAGHKSAERIGAAVDRDHDFPAGHRLDVLDDQHVRIPYATKHALGVAADHTVFHGADTQGAHDDQIVGVGIDVFGQDFPIPSFERATFDRKVGFSAFLIDVIEVGVGDDLEPAGNQRIVDLALPVEFFFIVVFLGKARFHLLEAFVVHFGRIDVAAHDLRAEGFGQMNSDVDGLCWNGRSYRPGYRSSYTSRCLLQALFGPGRTES